MTSWTSPTDRRLRGYLRPAPAVPVREERRSRPRLGPDDHLWTEAKRRGIRRIRGLEES